LFGNRTTLPIYWLVAIALTFQPNSSRWDHMKQVIVAIDNFVQEYFVS